MRLRTLRILCGIGLPTLVAGALARADGPVAAEQVASGLERPLLVAAPAGDGRLFVVERDGRIRILLRGELLEEPFLDVSASVSTTGEGGLLGLAFPPDHPETGLFYVYYTAPAPFRSVLSRFRVGADPDVADPTSEEQLLVVPQPFRNHNGGTIAFGPLDGYLYLGLGDGGSGFDPGELAQNPRELLGKMLRLDVGGGPGSPLSIPPDNPFAGDPDVRDEIWALGLRNPYRFGFDALTGDLWIADVGQNAREEVNFQPGGDPGGRNYGWDVMEGSLCVTRDPAPAPPCNDASLTLPVFEYGHLFGLCSIIGGTVYRGPYPAIQGLYFFGDLCTGQIWTFDPESGEVRDRSDELGVRQGRRFQLVGFGEDGSGELHVVFQGGDVFRIRSPDPACDDGFDGDGDGRVDAEDPACDAPGRDSELPRDDLRVDVLRRAVPPGSRGLVPVVVFGAEGYDLSRADADTLVLGPAEASARLGPFRLDLDRDGREDWVALFRTRETGIARGDDSLCAQVEIARVPFRGCDAVRTRPPGRLGR